MVAEDASSTHHPRYRPTCRICGRELPLSRRIVVIDARRFCTEHWRQYKIRQHEGVSSEDLNSMKRSEPGGYLPRLSASCRDMRTGYYSCDTPILALHKRYDQGGYLGFFLGGKEVLPFYVQRKVEGKEASLRNSFMVMGKEDLLSQYQREFDEECRRLFRQAG